MNRLFPRFVVLILLSVAAATIAIYLAISYFFGDPFEEIAYKQASAPIFLLEQYIDKAGSDEWLVRLNKVREVSKVRLDLIPLPQAQTALTPEQAKQLMRGELVLDVASKSFFRRVDLNGERYVGSADDVIHAQNLPIDVGLVLQMEILRYIIVAVCLLIPLAIWSGRHWRDLQNLSQVADAIGGGNLAVRAHVRNSASIAPLAQRINQMAARIGQLLDTQKSLLHSVSHELRTPIARLEFGLELLRNAAANPRLEGRIDAMEADVEELKMLVNELLSLGKLDQQTALTKVRFSVEAMLHDCLDHVSHAVDGKSLSASLANDLGNYAADQHLLARAVHNLLSNAAKYAEHQLRLSARRGKDGRLEITVDDDGPGIPSEEREHIFDAFYRLDRSRDRATGGYGLGLSIARKAVALHGGALFAEDSDLGGARFVLQLPSQPD